MSELTRRLEAELGTHVVDGLGRHLAGLWRDTLQAQKLERRSPRRRMPRAGMSGHDRQQALRVEGSGQGLVEPAVRRDRDDLGDGRRCDSLPPAMVRRAAGRRAEPPVGSGEAERPVAGLAATFERGRHGDKVLPRQRLRAVAADDAWRASVFRCETTQVPDPAEVVRSFVDAYDARDRARMRALLSADLVGYVTTADAGVDRVDGAEAYLARLPDPPDAELSLRVTQSVGVAPDQALAMVEIRARRGERELHNFGAFLSRVHDGRITEVWMVDALPALSYEFWSSAP